jgi:hypothetical protein
MGGNARTQSCHSAPPNLRPHPHLCHCEEGAFCLTRQSQRMMEDHALRTHHIGHPTTATPTRISLRASAAISTQDGNHHAPYPSYWPPNLRPHPHLCHCEEGAFCLTRQSQHWLRDANGITSPPSRGVFQKQGFPLFHPVKYMIMIVLILWRDRYPARKPLCERLP